MFRSAMVIILLVVACGLDVSAQATRNTGERQRDQTENEVHFVPSATFMIVPYLSGGMLVGDISDYMNDRGFDDAWRKAVFGLGFGGDHQVLPWLRAGAHTDIMLNKPATVQGALVPMWSIGISAMAVFQPRSRSSLYIRGETGLGLVNAVGVGDEMGGNPGVLSIGIGLQSFTSPTKAARTEVYYRVIYSEGLEGHPPYLPNPIPFNVAHVGVRFAMAFAL